jgi:hypothetical protein
MSAPRRAKQAKQAPAELRALLALFALFALLALAAVTAAAPPPPSAAGPARKDAAAAAGQAKPETYAEKVLVREIEVVVELPESLRESRRKALGPQDFQVLEDGNFRQVVKASPVAAAEPAPWHLVLYFDRVLADPDTVFFTANTLAQQAARLTALGAVDVVIADPQPRVALAECREPKQLEQALTELAAQAGRQRGAPRQAEARPQAPGQREAGRLQASGAKAGQPGAAAASSAAGLEPQAVRRQEDRLVALAAGHPGGGPHALVLVANGFDTSRSGGSADSATAAVAEEPARTLAAYGWITLAAPMRRQELGIEHRETTDVERIRQSNSGREAPGSSVPPEILPQAAPGSRLNYEGVLNVFVEPGSATLIAMASATAGMVIGYPGQLTAALDGLAKRWHLYYLAPDPEDGRPRPVEVRLSPGATVLRAPVWRRSSTTEEVPAARLRQLLAGGADHGTLAVRVTPAAADRRSFKVTVSPYVTHDPLTAGPYRLSVAFAGPAIAVPPVQHRLLSGAGFSEKGWTETLTLDVPAGARRAAVAVEDLSHQTWGATVTALPAESQPPAGR